MRFIEEIVVDDFLPTFRSLLAADLRERGLTQSEVAEALGVSQSAVSKYAHGGVRVDDDIAADDRVRALVERVGEGLASGEMTRVQALVETEVLIRRLEEGDLLAERHREAMPGLREHGDAFDIHDPEGAVRTAEQVRASVRRGLRILRNASGFAALVPDVGANLVECLPDAADIEDVAGVPGRIFDVRGTATVPSDPEFGVSEHVASLLLSARAAGVPVRGAVNVSYDPDLVASLRDDGVETVEFSVDGDAEGDVPRPAVVDALGALDTLPDPPFALYQTGGFGVEPITYVLAADAPAAARVVRDLARR